MGQTVIIRLVAKDDKSIIEVNKLLKKAGIKRTFNTEADNVAWFEDINKNPKSPQAHLKPITLEQLKGLFKLYCEPGVLFFDVAFSRTSQAEAKKYAEFILKHAQRIKELEGALSMIERYELSKHEVEIIQKLNKVVPDPVKLPKDQRTK